MTQLVNKFKMELFKKRNSKISKNFKNKNDFFILLTFIFKILL